MTKARTLTPLDNNPLHAEAVHMVDGLTDNEMNSFLEEHPTIVPLFEVNVLSAMEPYVAYGSDGGLQGANLDEEFPQRTRDEARRILAPL